MEPTNFPESNLDLGAGNNPGTVGMRVCVATREIEGQNVPFAVSAWKASPEEIEEFNRTGIIYIAVMGWPVPPVSVIAFNPFENYGYVPLQPEQPEPKLDLTCEYCLKEPAIKNFMDRGVVCNDCFESLSRNYEQSNI